MSLDSTTLASALTVLDTVAVVASATGIARGDVFRVDGETAQVSGGYVVGSVNVPLLRGQQGTTAQAHPASAKVLTGEGSDTAWGDFAPTQTVQYAIGQRPVVELSYSADGAITLPTAGAHMRAVLNSTVALAMTVAAPSKALDGSQLVVAANGKAAHTVTVDGSVGIGDAGSSYNLVTFLAGGQVSFKLTATNGFWLIEQIGATNTNIVPTIA